MLKKKKPAETPAKKGLPKRDAKEIDEIKSSAKSDVEAYKPHRGSDLFLSTGCTLLDLAVSGGRVRGGGIPGGILMEVFGPSSSGKTAVLVELGASAEAKGGVVRYQDPEARLDREVSRIYGLSIADKHYFRPDTVTAMMDNLIWEPERTDVINVDCVDSLAALSTDLEMDKGDKMGMRRAKEFSEGCRKLARYLASGHRLVACSNQERQGDHGTTTPGGNAVPYYASLRLRIYKAEEVTREVRLESGVKVSKAVGIKSMCVVKKSSVDDPFRMAPLYITFGVGIDDVRGNLQWLKDMKKETTYVVAGKSYQGMEQAIAAVERNNLEEAIREEVIDLWEHIEQKFHVERKPKKRF